MTLEPMWTSCVKQVSLLGGAGAAWPLACKLILRTIPRLEASRMHTTGHGLARADG
jgi:hypothetical protein